MNARVDGIGRLSSALRAACSMVLAGLGVAVLGHSAELDALQVQGESGSVRIADTETYPVSYVDSGDLEEGWGGGPPPIRPE